MSKFSKESLKRYEICGIAGVIIGMIMVFTASFLYEPEAFSECYIAGLRSVGYLVIVWGVMWLVFALLHSRTRYFDVDARMDADKAILSLVATGIVTIAICCYCVGKIQTTQMNKLPMDPKAREAVLKREQRDKRYVVTGILTVGAILAMFPGVRLYRGTRKS